MAARPDQNLQIGLIVCALLIVALAAATWWGWSSYNAETKVTAQLSEEKSAAETEVRKIVEESNQFRRFIGVTPEANIEEVNTEFEKDMESFGRNFGESDRYYRKLLANYFTETTRLSKEASEAKARESALQGQLRQKEQEKDDQIKKYQDELAKVKADAAAERERFAEDTQKFEALNKKLAQEFEARQASFEEQLTSLQGTIREGDGKLDDVETQLRRALDRVPPEIVTLDIADGAVTYVNQREGKVWINLGQSDGVRRQVTFSVLAQGDADAGAAESKGSIEVIRVLGENMAEARVTSDDPRNPILPGDSIYSQVWDPGSVQRFALAGLIDLNGDGRGDLPLAKDLIERNGGVLDAVVEEDGTVTGAISVNTTQLVLGEFPEDASRAKQREGWQNLSEQAQKYAVNTTTLGRFLRQMGYTPEDRAVNLGVGARSDDFFKRRPSTGDFRPRSPYATP